MSYLCHTTTRGTARLKYSFNLSQKTMKQCFETKVDMNLAVLQIKSSPSGLEASRTHNNTIQQVNTGNSPLAK